MASDHASSSGVAERYAEALFDLAKDEGALDAIEADLKALAASIEQSDELAGFIRNPVYTSEDQLAVVDALSQKANHHALTANFLKLVAKNRRLFALRGVIKAFAKLAAEARGEVGAEAISAAPLNDDQIKALRHEIEAKVGKAVNLETRVDPGLLGGLVVKIGSQMIDASLKTKLNRMKTLMKEA